MKKMSLHLKNDLNIWIKRVITDEPFEEEWAKRNPNPEAYKVDVKFYYGNSLVDTDLYVSVDGYRAIVPLTNSRDSYDVKNQDT